MQKGKIVKSIVALAIAGGVVAGVYSFTNKSKTENGIYDEESGFINSEELVSDTVLEMETMTPEEETVFIEVVGPKKEPVGQIEVYRTIDFTKVTNPTETYELLLKKRTEYYNVMKKVCASDMFYNDAERAAAVYNIVRIDNDLAGLMVKISEQRREQVKSDYLDVQVEKLENLQKEIDHLKAYLEDAENIWKNDIDKVEETEREQILKVKKYNELALKQEVKRLEKQLKETKKELENTAMASPQ